MTTVSSTSLKNHGEKRNPFAEVSNAEKHLWAHIHSQGLLHNNVRGLYRKACCMYENLFLSENELPDLQNIEYLLWRLHYKHIDEFRKRILHNPSKGDDKLSASRRTIDAHVEGFKLFLSEATRFYQDLIRKIKRYYGLLEEPWFYKNDGVSGRIDQAKLHKCQFVCHRLCICLGDLARYLQLYERPGNKKSNWTAAASHYLEAAKIYPDGGNPQNQLAVLATYIGDEFLALYHCIRSLAVKEPFPDALQNLVLLIERNRSSNISSLTDEAYDFRKPSEWISKPIKAAADIGFSIETTLTKQKKSEATDLWALIIRTTSFFFLETSLDSFPCTFTSTLKELEVFLSLDVAKLSSALDSYQNMNLSKAGPYRALHIIAVLLFIIHNLTAERENKFLQPKNEMQQSALMKLALTVTFTFMGRFVDRCLKGSPVIYCPLLPALLVFMEWLVHANENLPVDDEKCETSMRYFFRSLVKLLNLLQENKAQVKFSENIALWEDYELRGFMPLSHTHVSLDFSSHWEKEINYKMKSDYRAHRIVQAAAKIVKKSNNYARRWLLYSDKQSKFSTMGSEVKQTSSVEEEEDIVFKPITRRNSEPMPPIKCQGAAEASNSDECLRRASSLLVAQNRALIDTFTCHSDFLSPTSSSKPLSQNDPRGKIPSTLSDCPIAAGPPSLSSWVLNGERLSGERAKSKEIHRSMLKPIDEMASEELGALSLSKDESASTSSSTTSVSAYYSPVPSAPLLPENASWFANTSAGFSLQNAATDAPSYPPPFMAPTSPYPWSYDFQQTSNSVYASDVQTFDLLDGLNYNPPLSSSLPLLDPGSPLLRGLYDQRASPFLSPPLIDMRPEPQPLLQHLKQREWQLQQEAQFAGSPYLQNLKNL